jgi:hypothetical protein
MSYLYSERFFFQTVPRRPLASGGNWGQLGATYEAVAPTVSGVAPTASDTAIRNAKPGAKPVRMFDGGVLYLEVAPSGGKWWRLKYRHDSKEKRLSLGARSARRRHA